MTTADMRTTQRQMEFPDAPEVAHMARSMTTHFFTSETKKKRGSIRVYDDGKIRIQSDTYVPKVSIEIVRGREGPGGLLSAPPQLGQPPPLQPRRVGTPPPRHI